MENLKESATSMGITTMDSLLETIATKAPEALDQLIFLCTIKSIIECVIGILALLITCLIVKYALAKPYENNNCRIEQWGNEGKILHCLIVITVAPLSLAIGLTSINLDWLYLLLTPKAYILIELGKLL